MNTVRTVADAKHDFYQDFSKPVNSIYRRVIDELLVEVHLLRVSQTFAYDPIFALGLATAFDRFMAGYEPESDLVDIFKALCVALQFDFEQVRLESADLIGLATSFPAAVKDLLALPESSESNESLEKLTSLATPIKTVTNNPKFKYSRLFAVGVFTLLEITSPELIADSEQRQALITQVSAALNLSSERVLKDLDLYRSNLEKIQQNRQMMADMVEAERKKREKQTKVES